jgi:glycosyltransferase involved in cell wall biosynthesis
MANPRPLLIVSDAIAASSGLGRIARDLSVRIKANLSDVYRLGTAGYGSPGSCKFDIPQYNLEGMKNWVLPTLPQIWNDFAGKEKGIIMFIWDLSRVSWFSDPVLGKELLTEYPFLEEWLATPSFEKWIYAPIDATGPNDRLTFPLARTVLGFDRILAYSSFGGGVIRRSIGDEAAAVKDLTYLPHGIDGDMFYQMDRAASRKAFFRNTFAATLIGQPPKPIADDEVLIGIVATNQSRKNWDLGIETVALLRNRGHKVRLWIHTNARESYWSIDSLLMDYSLVYESVVSLGQVPDEKMAVAYSACDLTLGIGLGEGFGYPLFESMFCGTPCVHGDYGGAPEYLASTVQGVRMNENDPLLVKPIGFFKEGEYANVRPVFNATDWADKAEALIGARMNHNGNIEWKALWPHWEAWFREAAK